MASLRWTALTVRRGVTAVGAAWGIGRRVGPSCAVAAEREGFVLRFVLDLAVGGLVADLAVPGAGAT
jgi:hypothetical protein